MKTPFISAYLLRPLRTLDQATHDLTPESQRLSFVDEDQSQSPDSAGSGLSAEHDESAPDQSDFVSERGST